MRYIHVTFADNTWHIFEYRDDESTQFNAAIAEFSSRLLPQHQPAPANQLAMGVRIFSVYRQD